MSTSIPTDRAAPPKVAIYARYSSDKQTEYSTVRQVRACLEYAAKQGWPAVPKADQYVDERISGRKTVAREGYQRLLTALRSGNGHGYDVVLIEDFDRLNRSMKEMVHLRDMAPVWRVTFLDVTKRTEISATSHELVNVVDGWAAQDYIKKLKARVHGGQAERFRAGYHAGGYVYGYQTEPILDPAGGKGFAGGPKRLGCRIEPDPKTAPVIRRIFTECASGMTPGEIARQLTVERVPRPCANYVMKADWTREFQTKPWSATTVRKLLRHERYRGVWRWDKTTKVWNSEEETNLVRQRSTEEIITRDFRTTRPDLVLIDEQTWAKVQRVLDGRSVGLRRGAKGLLLGREKGSPGPPDRANIFQGLLFCSQCKGPLHILLTERQGKIRRLGCKRHAQDKKACANNGTFRLDHLEPAVVVALEGYFSDSRLATKRMKRFLEETAKAIRSQREAETVHEREREGILNKIERVKGIILDGAAGPTTASMLKALEAQLSQVDAKIAAAGELKTSRPVMRPPEEIIKTLRIEAWYERRAALRQLIQRIELKAVHQKGRRKAVRWEGRIVPVPTAGITGLSPLVIESYTSRHLPSAAGAI